MQFRKTNSLTETRSKSNRLYGQTSMWLAMLKVGGTGLLMSFMMALFTFVDQLMLINLMPNTHTYSFDSLFIIANDNVFAPLMSGIDNFNSATVSAIANVSGLELFSSADIVRAAISSSSALIFLIQAFPGIVSMGIVILYSKSLGANRIDAAKEIWQNSLIAATISGFVGFAILIILIPTVTPTQATSMTISFNKIQSSANAISDKLSNAGLNPMFFSGNTYTIFTNGQEYFVPVLSNGHMTYLNVSHNSLLSGQYIVVNDPGDLISFSFSTNSLLQSWNNYFEAVRNYSIKWAENFLFILDVALLLECFVNIFIGVLRAEGEIRVTTIITVITIGINILLDYLFISLAQIGMEGAATASIIGFVIQITLLGCFIEFSKNAQFRFSDLRHLRVNWKLIGEFAKLGINKLVGVVGMMVTTILLTREIILVASQLLPGSGSEYYISIVGAVMPFVTLFYSSITGVAKNIVQLYSYNMGSENYKRVKEAYWFAFGYLLAIGLVIFGLFGVCDPIKVGLLNWFHITAASPNNQLVSSERLMLLWMIQVPIFAFMINATVVFLVGGRIKTAILVSLIRSVIVPIPMIYIWGAIAMHGFGTDLSMIPSENIAMWFFMTITPSYTAVYSAIIFVMSTIFLYTTMFKKPVGKSKEMMGGLNNKPTNEETSSEVVIVKNSEEEHHSETN